MTNTEPHQATRIGGYYYAYDANENLSVESETPIAASGAGSAPRVTRQGDVRIVEEAWGYDHQKEQSSSGYRRYFSWDSENRLKEVKSGTRITRFLYDAAGERTGKIGERGETLYFNAWFTSREDGAIYRNSKHIFVGSHRAVTRLNADTGGTWEAEDLTTYYYHPDHLGSVSVVSDRRGDPYERIEYTPYGEMWQEVRHDGNTAASKYIPYRFTAKEWDEETGLYYHGARYYEPRLSRWISADPAGFSLSRPMNARGEPRRGYSIVEAANWYSYVSNNPVKYVDPTGMTEEPWYLNLLKGMAAHQDVQSYLETVKPDGERELYVKSEFGTITGSMRIDFVHEGSDGSLQIYEIKPNNRRAGVRGRRQLARAQNLLAQSGTRAELGTELLSEVDGMIIPAPKLSARAKRPILIQLSASEADPGMIYYNERDPMFEKLKNLLQQLTPQGLSDSIPIIIPVPLPVPAP